MRPAVIAVCLLTACGGRSVEITIPPPACELANGKALPCPPSLTLLWHRDNPIPSYGPLLVSAGAWGRVTAQVRVAPSGAVDSVATLETTNLGLSGAVRTALKQWRFDPFMPNADTSHFSAESPARPLLTVEVLFRAYGCDKEKDPKVAVFAMRGSLLLEIVKCKTVNTIVDIAGRLSADTALARAIAEGIVHESRGGGDHSGPFALVDPDSSLWGSAVGTLLRSEHPDLLVSPRTHTLKLRVIGDVTVTGDSAHATVVWFRCTDSPGTLNAWRHSVIYLLKGSGDAWHFVGRQVAESADGRY